jgi:hypothetical protein
MINTDVTLMIGEGHSRNAGVRRNYILGMILAKPVTNILPIG